MLCAAGIAAENFPPPEFTTNYQHLVPSAPPARADAFAYVDLAMLAITLLLAGWFIHRRRARRELLIVTVFAVLYFGFYRHGCICAVGAVQNVAQAIGQSGYALPLAVGVIFLLPLLAALIAGRVFCAAVCPLGALQELMVQRPLKVPSWLDHPLSLLPYVYLGAATLFAATGSIYLICRYDPFVGFFRLSGPLSMIVAGVALLLIGVVVGRPYCRYLCPYGVLLRWLAPLAKWRMRITPAECVQCHLCAHACPYGAIRPPTPAEDAPPRGAGRARLAVLLLLLPVLVALGGWLGARGAGAFTRWHPTAIRADAAWERERNLPRSEDMSPEAIDPTSPNITLYREALAVRRQYDMGAPLLGGWIGLVLGMKLLFLSIRRRRVEYEIDQAACLGCGRCYESCPVGRKSDEERAKDTIGV